MKRMVALIAGVVSVGALAYVGSRLGAQPNAAAPQTRIAMVNVSQVIKGYAKWKVFNDQLKVKVDGYEKQLKDLKEKQDQYVKAVQDPRTSATDKDSYEKAVKTLRNQMQELADDGKQAVGKMQADQYTILYNDVKTVVTDMAGPRGLELVLQYNDVFAGEPSTNPLSVQRKLMSDGAMPIYSVPGMDITQAVTETLNARYTSAMPGTPTAAAPGH